MSVEILGQVPVYFVATPGLPSRWERREHCKITVDLARRLGFPVPASAAHGAALRGSSGRLPEPFQIRLGVTRQDADASSHESYAEHVGSAAVFTVDEIIAGAGRAEIYPNSRLGGQDGGVYKLFRTDVLPVDSRVTLWNKATSSTRVDDAVATHFAEPARGRYFREIIESGSPDLCVLAPHGGSIETETSDQLAMLKHELQRLGIVPTVWDCRGSWGGDETRRRWHVRADEMQRASFPGLDHLLTAFPPFRFAVALDGFRWGLRPDAAGASKRGIILGGRAPKCAKLALRKAIEQQIGIRGLIAFYIADEREGDESFPGIDGDLAMFGELSQVRGTGARHVVHRLSPAGLVIQQSLGVRRHAILAEKVAVGAARALEQRLSLPSEWCYAATA